MTRQILIYRSFYRNLILILQLIVHLCCNWKPLVIITSWEVQSLEYVVTIIVLIYLNFCISIVLPIISCFHTLSDVSRTKVIANVCKCRRDTCVSLYLLCHLCVTDGRILDEFIKASEWHKCYLPISSVKHNTVRYNVFERT